MNRTKCLTVKFGIACFGALAAALTVCAQSGEEPRDVSVQVGLSVQTDTAYATIRTESDFIEPLSPYGRWEVVGSYGRCWIPNGMETGWRPYSNGSWQQTDAGWYWVSDEPWGWATYHYGRWDSSAQFGWYWVPQTQWAPAWVSWREGGGFVGWAPMGPSGREAAESNERAYVFVDEHHFTEPVRTRTVTVNNTAFNKTVVITNTHVVNKTVINEGPATAAIEKASGQKIQVVPVHQIRSKEEAKVVAKQASPAPATAKTVTTPTPRQADKAPPAGTPSQVEKPALANKEPQPPAAKNEVKQADTKDRVAKPDAEKRVQQEEAQKNVSEHANPEAKSESNPVAKSEARPAPNPEARPEANPVAKPEAKPIAKPEIKPKAKPEPKPETNPDTKGESKPAAEPATESKAPAEQKPAKDDEKKDS